MQKKVNYRAYYINNSGKKMALDAQQLIVELAPGKSIDISLTPHPSGLAIGKFAEQKPLHMWRDPTEYSVLIVRPSACNIINIDIETHLI